MEFNDESTRFTGSSLALPTRIIFGFFVSNTPSFDQATFDSSYLSIENSFSVIREIETFNSSTIYLPLWFPDRKFDCIDGAKNCSIFQCIIDVYHSENQSSNEMKRSLLKYSPFLLENFEFNATYIEPVTKSNYFTVIVDGCSALNPQDLLSLARVTQEFLNEAFFSTYRPLEVTRVFVEEQLLNNGSESGGDHKNSPSNSTCFHLNVTTEYYVPPIMANFSDCVEEYFTERNQSYITGLKKIEAFYNVTNVNLIDKITDNSMMAPTRAPSQNSWLSPSYIPSISDKWNDTTYIPPTFNKTSDINLYEPANPWELLVVFSSLAGFVFFFFTFIAACERLDDIRLQKVVPIEHAYYPVEI